MIAVLGVKRCESREAEDRRAVEDVQEVHRQEPLTANESQRNERGLGPPCVAHELPAERDRCRSGCENADMSRRHAALAKGRNREHSRDERARE